MVLYKISTFLGLSVPNSPLIAKSYDASLIKVTDITDGVVGELSTFRGKISSTFYHQVPLIRFLIVDIFTVISIRY